MGGKYEIRYHTSENTYATTFTNKWLKFMKLRITKKVIYYTVRY